MKYKFILFSLISLHKFKETIGTPPLRTHRQLHRLRARTHSPSILISHFAIKYIIISTFDLNEWEWTPLGEHKLKIKRFK